jgi:DNA-binding MarR family transcriptional regulator
MDPITSLENTIRQITHLLSDMEAEAFRVEGFAELSMRQVLYMDTIARMGHPSFGELAEALGVSRPSVTTLVGKLIRNGYLDKIQDGEDRRSFHIILTDKGNQFTQTHQSMHIRIVEALTSRLKENEVKQLSELLHKAIGG